MTAFFIVNFYTFFLYPSWNEKLIEHVMTLLSDKSTFNAYASRRNQSDMYNSVLSLLFFVFRPLYRPSWKKKRLDFKRNFFKRQ